LGVWAEEVGVPYVDKTQPHGSGSAFLTSDSHYIYTYSNNFLRFFSTNPIILLNTITIEDEDFINKSGIDIYALNNNKIIFTSINGGIGLFDLSQKKFLKKIKSRLHNAKLTKDNFITVNKDRTVRLYETSSLKLLREIQIPKYKKYAEYSEYREDVSGMFLGNNGQDIVVLTDARLIILDAKTLDIKREIQEKFGVIGEVAVHYGISLDQKRLYDNGKYYFDLSTYSIFASPKESDCYITNRTFSETSSHMLVKCQKINEVYEKINVTKLFSIYQFQKNDWLIITPNGYFDGSPESRKYLYMKTPSGESVPIDDATFQKFHKQINLKD
jgi:hypothetical protein